MRVCVVKATGELIEAQSGDQAPLDVLVQNALTAGHALEDIEAKVVSSAEYAALRTPSLADAKIRARRRIDTAAEAARLAYVTDGAAMALVYRQKYAEALAWQADNEQVGPLLQAEAARTGSAAADIVATWSAKASAWLSAAAAIETIRHDALDAIETSGDVQAVQAVLDTLPAWPSP